MRISVPKMKRADGHWIDKYTDGESWMLPPTDKPLSPSGRVLPVSAGRQVATGIDEGE